MPTRADQTSPATQQGTFSTDNPVLNSGADRLGRATFARRLADTLALRSEPASLVVGIYGEWGEGKTTVLNFLRERLSEHASTLVVTFNPWRYPTSETMERGFVDALAQALSFQPRSTLERVGAFTKQNAPLAGSAAAITKVDTRTFEGIGSMLDADLDSLRSRVETELERRKKRAILIFDDIDRLDRDEILAVFRLIKVVADYKHTAYVLALDEAIVSEVLATRYPNSPDNGSRFLDKIIQVPLALPRVDPNLLETMTLEGLDEVLRSTGIRLNENEEARFREAFLGLASQRLRTLRDAKRFLNACAFSLPIMKGELNPVDLILVEFLRVVWPELYNLVRTRPDLVCGEAPQENDGNKVLAELNPLFTTASSDEQASAQQLLSSLFPRLLASLSNTYVRESEAWRKQQRIASEFYFDRYFSYGLPVGDLSDTSMSEFVDSFALLEPTGIAEGMKTLVAKSSPSRFLTKIIAPLAQAPAISAEKFARALALSCEQFPGGIGHFMSPFSSAAFLTRTSLGQLPTERRVVVAGALVSSTPRLEFAYEMLRQWQVLSSTEQMILEKQAISEMATLLVARIQTECENGSLFTLGGDSARALYLLWKHHGNADKLRRHIRDWLNDDPARALLLVRTFVSESGVFGDNSEYSLLEIADGVTLVSLLEKSLGASFWNSATGEQSSDLLRGRRVAIAVQRTRSAAVER